MSRTLLAMSLLEVMMASAIFAAGAAAVISATATYSNVQEHERKLTNAWRILQGDAARMRGLGDAAVEWSADSTALYDAVGNTVVADPAFTVERTVELNEPFSGARRLTLTARWQERVGPRSSSLVMHR